MIFFWLESWYCRKLIKPKHWPKRLLKSGLDAPYTPHIRLKECFGFNQTKPWPFNPNLQNWTKLTKTKEIIFENGAVFRTLYRAAGIVELGIYSFRKVVLNVFDVGRRRDPKWNIFFTFHRRILYCSHLIKFNPK